MNFKAATFKFIVSHGRAGFFRNKKTCFLTCLLDLKQEILACITILNFLPILRNDIPDPAYRSWDGSSVKCHKTMFHNIYWGSMVEVLNFR